MPSSGTSTTMAMHHPRTLHDRMMKRFTPRASRPDRGSAAGAAWLLITMR
jgi:hypothetical protein